MHRLVDMSGDMPCCFYLNEATGKSEVVDPDGCDYAGCCEAAEENCPVEAIMLEE